MWSFGIFQFLLKILLSPKRVFFTEIPPRPRSPKCRKNVHINIGPYQVGFLCTSIMAFISDIHKNRCTSEITTESANMKLFIFMSKVNMGTLPSTPNTFSMLLDSVCAVMALITNCDRSQIATIVSQFVTVAICDGSKCNFSDWCQLYQKVNF